jgi:hypothetical protein
VLGVDISLVPAPRIDVYALKCSISVVRVIFGLIAEWFWSVFADGNLDTLARKRFAQRRTFNDTGKLLGRENLELLRKAGGQHRGTASIEGVVALPTADIYKVHLESGNRISALIQLETGRL